MHKISFNEWKSLQFFAYSKINKEIRRNQRRVADDVSDWLNSTPVSDQSWAVWSQSLVSAKDQSKKWSDSLSRKGDAGVAVSPQWRRHRLSVRLCVYVRIKPRKRQSVRPCQKIAANVGRRELINTFSTRDVLTQCVGYMASLVHCRPCKNTFSGLFIRPIPMLCAATFTRF